VAGLRVEMGGATSWLPHLDAVGSLRLETDMGGGVNCRAGNTKTSRVAQTLAL
jgi:hypothetical protein